MDERRFFEDTGTPWVRVWADWPEFEPLPGVHDEGSLARLDEDVDAARVDGRRVMLTTWRVTPWATPSGDPYRLPPDLSPASDWARWIGFLLERYSGRIDALELMNEPNFQLHGATPDEVARMMVTAQQLASARLGAPLLVAPATADVPGYDAFTSDLLDRLDARGFEAGPRFAWSHHSYNDVEGDTAERTGRVGALLAGRWPLFITETGARLNVIESPPQPRQAELLDRYWQRMQFGPEGEGVMAVFQYLFVSSPNYDSGLCDPDGTPRAAYRSWARLPAFD